MEINVFRMYGCDWSVDTCACDFDHYFQVGRVMIMWTMKCIYLECLLNSVIEIGNETTWLILNI